MIAQELEVSLHMAFVEARQARHEFITVEHLLLALLDNPTAAAVLRACAANIDDLRKNLTHFINDNTPVVSGTDEIDTQPTLGFQRVIQRAMMHVQSTANSKKEVTGANVMVAIFGEKDSHAVYYLHQQGITRLDVVNFISHGITKNPAQQGAGSETENTDGDAGKKDTSLAALHSALDVLRFRLDYRRERALELADRGRLWGDLIAIDAALDAGDVDTAGVLLRAQTELQPAHWVRQLRLARIRGELADATNLAKKLETVEPTPRGTYERMMLAIAKNETRDLPCSAVPCSKGHIDADLGGAFAQAEKCILAYAKPEQRGDLVKNLADESSAFTLRLVCALAMAKTHTPKAREYARSVLAGANGDVQKLGELLKSEPEPKDDKPEKPPKKRRP